MRASKSREFFTYQELLGHSDVDSTMIDTHGLNRGRGAPRALLDAREHRERYAT